MASAPGDQHLTRLKGVTAEGELVLVTEDRAVQTRPWLRGKKSKFSSLGWRRGVIVSRWVTSVVPTKPFQFTVLADEAIKAPCR